MIGPKHSYSFTATCGEEHTSRSGELTWIGYSSSTKNTGFSFTVQGKASWDRKTGEGSESLILSGDIAGKRSARGVCNQDPWLKDPPGSPAGCHGIEVQYQSEKGPTYEILVQPFFFLQRTVALAEAQALSQQKPAPPPPPPPPAKPKSMSSPSGAAMWEAEELFRQKKVQVNGGQLGPQPMEGFGPEWSGNAQLLWTGGQVGAVLDLLVQVDRAGRYTVRADLPSAPDYAMLGAEVDGKSSPVKIDGFSPTVARGEPVELGTFSLGSGIRTISFMIIGKNSQSKGFLVGVDRITLTPAGRLNTRGR